LNKYGENVDAQGGEKGDPESGMRGTGKARKVTLSKVEKKSGDRWERKGKCYERVPKKLTTGKKAIKKIRVKL